MDKNAILDVEGVTKEFPIKKGFLKRTVGMVRAVDNITLTFEKGKTYGLIGESGCGKSTLGYMIMGLVPVTKGNIYYYGERIPYENEKKMKTYRKKIQLIFQDPYASLDPKMKVRDIVIEPMENHHLYPNKSVMYEKAAELLTKVGLSEDVMNRYPHEFSGGQRQRIAIARVLAVNPELIIADESTAALDVSVQAQILNLLKTIQKEMDLTIIFISHNLNVVKHLCESIIVMYMGEIVEIADKQSIYKNPLHPYTKALISAVPVPDPTRKGARLILKGELSNENFQGGCALADRCPLCMDCCRVKKPNLISITKTHQVACHLVKQEGNDHA